MRVLVACEFSGVVREAFRKRGHDAWSCDLLPAEDNSAFHYQGDVKFFMPCRKWDLMIAHPPCTYLCNSGVKHLYADGKKSNGRDEGRWAKMRDAAEFFLWLHDAPIPHCIENPIMHGYATEIFADCGFPTKPSQIIQPWQFGHGETKATGIWLVGLPLLYPTQIVSGRSPRVHYASPGPNRWKERSRTLQGIADAMALQWG